MPSALTIARTLEVRRTFRRTETSASASLASYVDVSGNGFFPAMIEMLWVLGSRLVTATGTTAPLSAMSGAVITISLLSIRFLAPRLFSAAYRFRFKSGFVPGRGKPRSPRAG